MAGLPTRCVLLSGATGLVGNAILGKLLSDPAERIRIIAPGRSPPTVTDPRLLAPVGDWSDPLRLQALGAALDQTERPDTWICALGTTLKRAGSLAGFLAIDLHLVLRMGALAKELGVRQAIVVSSIGADSAVQNFYLSVKGKAEDGLRALSFTRLDLLRPSLLLGARQEHRAGEALGQRLAPWFNPLLIGPLRRYRAIPATVVAQAAVRLLGRPEPGCFVHTYAQMAHMSG